MKVALWQCEQRSADVPGNLERLRWALLDASGRRVDLLVCPEMFLTGYSLDLPVLERLAEPADGPSARTIADLARQSGVAIVWGFPERDSGGAIHDAVQAVDATGGRLGHYRKTHLYGAVERRCFRASDGQVVLFQLFGWRVGLLICYDVEFPEAVRNLALAGADLVVVPTANMQGFEAVPRLLVPARAYENQVVVAYANCCGVERGLVYGGLSTLAGADGTVLAQAGVGPALLCFDIGSPTAKAARLPYLSDRRPDTYRSLTAEPGPGEPPIR